MLILPAGLPPSSSGCQKFHHIHNWETSRGNQGLSSPWPWGATRNRAIRLSSFPHHQTFSSAALPMPLANDLLTPKERGMRDAKVSLQRLLHPSPPLKPPHFPESAIDPHRAGRGGGSLWPAQNAPNSLASKPRDLMSVIAQPLMVRVGNLWQATSSLYTFYLIFRGTLGYMTF